MGLIAILHAAPMGEQEVRINASLFLSKPFFASGVEIASLQPPSQDMPYWTAALDPEGFLILNPDTDGLPVVGFATSGRLITEAGPENAMQKMLATRIDPSPTQSSATEAWSRSQPQFKPLSVTATNQILMDPQAPSRILVEPLLATHWTQWAPFNLFCPVVSNGLPGYEGRAPTGCVPVVLGQILRYYSWPDMGKGTNSVGGY